MATRLNPTNFGYQNFFSTTLTGDITSGTLSIGLATVPTPSSGILIIEPDSTSSREVIVYTSKGASTITCPSDGRGYSGTSAAAHLTGSTVIMAPVDKWFTALASGELSTDPLRTELFYDYVASGMVWTGDAYASTRNASMTSGVIYINGRRLTASAVAARTFTASKDTYIDASDNGDGTVLLTYTEVSNNAASPALAANNVRIGIIVTGASNIAAAGSVNQGEENKVLPIVSGIPYCFTDSIGNIICPRDPQRRILGIRRNATDVAVNGAQQAITNVPVIVPTGRKVRISLFGSHLLSAGAQFIDVFLYDGVIGAGPTTLSQFSHYLAAASQSVTIQHSHVVTPTSTNKTYSAGISVTASTATLKGATASPAYVMVELV